MSRIPPGKVLVKAGKFEGGKLPYLSYVGQIKPSDMTKIIWWGAYGNDTTGDGSISAPFLTFDRALEAFSTTQHKWILKTDLSVYGETGPGPYIDNPAGRVYLDPTRPDDSGDGLTPATAKKTYAAAKVALTSSGRSAIHCIGSFTLSDRIDARTQGEIGQTLTYDRQPLIQSPATIYSEASTEFSEISINPVTGTMIACGSLLPNTFIIRRSVDGGNTWSSVSLPAVQRAEAAAVCVNGVWIVLALRRTGAVGTNVLRSVDDGVTWTVQTVNNRAFSDLIYSNGRFIALSKQSGGTQSIFSHWSIDGITWNEINLGLTSPANIWPCRMAHNGAGTIVMVGYRLILPNNDEPVIAVSTDNGNSWSNVSASLTGSPGYSVPLTPLSVWYSNNKWFVYCHKNTGGEIWSSSNLSTWTIAHNTVRFIQSSFSMNPINGQKVDASELYNSPVVLCRVMPGANYFFVQIGDTSLTILSENTGFTPSVNQRIIKYRNVEYFFIPSSTAIFRNPMLQVSILADCTNINVNLNRTVGLNINAKVFNITSVQTTQKAIASLIGCSIVRSHAMANNTAVEHYGEKLIIRRCLIKAEISAKINGTALVANDIEISQSAIIGKVQLNNTGGTDKELIRDNIIEGDFIAAAPVTVHSNIRGAVVNTSGLSRISTINPIFKDTTDYELSRVALGQSVDSPLIKLSAFYSYTYNSQTYKDDLGAYRAFVALVKTSFKRAFLLPKFSGNALNEDVENVATLLKSINGVPDVSTRPDARLEIVSWTSKTIDSQVREFISYLERQKSTLVELYYDGDESVLSSIVVNGAHSSGTFEVNITPKDVPVGTVLWLFGKLRYVVQRYPRAGDATKLILDDVLEGGLTNGQTIEIAQIQGGGEYVFVPEQRRQNQRVFSRKRDAYTGMKYTFVRKAL